MNEERSYQICGKYLNLFIDYVIKVTVGQNILAISEKELPQDMNRNDWILLNIIEIQQCDGCMHHSLGQKDHMGHPDGCLHTPSLCDICHIE